MRTLLLALSIIAISSNSIVAQKLIKNMSSDICDCLVDIKDDYKSSEPKEVLSKCFGPVMKKYEKQIKKKYGEDVFEMEANRKVYDIGIEVGKSLAADCPAYLNLFYDQIAKKNNSSSTFYDKAEELYSQGAYKEAIENYTQAISIFPENQGYYNSRGVSYFELEEYYLAISDFMSAIKIKPDFSLGHYNMAYAKHQLGDHQKALLDVKNALEFDSAYCDSYNLMGLIYDNLNESESAYLSFKAAYNCDTSNSLYANNTAYILYENEKYEDALPYFTSAILKGSDDESIYSYIGNCYNNLGMYEKAVEAHTSYIELNDKDYIGYYNRGLSLINMKNYESAISDYKLAASCDSTDSDIFYKLGQCFEQLNYSDEAEINFNKAIQMSSDNAGYYDSRASFYAGIGKYEAAIQDSKISLGLYPDDCNIYMLMSDWYKKLNELEKSEESLKKAFELGCENTKAE